MSPAAIGWSVVTLRGWPVAVEPPADGGEHGVGTAEAGGSRDRDGGAVGDQGRGLIGRHDLGKGHSRSVVVSGNWLAVLALRLAGKGERDDLR